jgi:hypothetical protein
MALLSAGMAVTWRTINNIVQECRRILPFRGLLIFLIGFIRAHWRASRQWHPAFSAASRLAWKTGCGE